MERPKLLDFGIAKLSQHPFDAQATLTQGLLGTLQYMSPEQLRGHPIGKTSDVYALGAILYELLSGHRAFDVMCAGIDQVLLEAIRQAVHEKIPKRPSTVASDALTKTGVSKAQVAERRQTNPSNLRRCLKGDIDNIAMMALRKEPERRYASAADLCADIQRCLEDRPVRAQPDSSSYRMRKLVRRHRKGLTVFCGFAVCVAVASAAVSFGRRASVERAKEEVQRHVADAQVHIDEGNLPRAIEELDAALTATPNASPLRDAIRQMRGGWRPYLGTPISEDPGSRPTFSEDGSIVMETSRDGVSTLWNTKDHQAIRQFDSGSPVESSSFSAASNWFATLNDVHQFQAWNVQSGETISWPRPPGRVMAWHISGDEVQLFVATEAKWELLSCSLLQPVRWKSLAARPKSFDLISAQFVGRNAFVVRYLKNGLRQLALWSAATLEAVLQIEEPISQFTNMRHRGDVLAVSFKQNGGYKTIVWDVEGRSRLGKLEGRVVDVNGDGRTCSSVQAADLFCNRLKERLP